MIHAFQTLMLQPKHTETSGSIVFVYRHPLSFQASPPPPSLPYWNSLRHYNSLGTLQFVFGNVMIPLERIEEDVLVFFFYGMNLDKKHRFIQIIHTIHALTLQPTYKETGFSVVRVYYSLSPPSRCKQGLHASTTTQPFCRCNQLPTSFSFSSFFLAMHILWAFSVAVFTNVTLFVG